MPVGSFSLIYHYANELQRHRPKSVLDLGIGFGMMGALVREYLDNGVRHDAPSFSSEPGAPPRKVWGTQLIGVEGFEGYRNPAWDLYDIVNVNDIADYVKGTLTRLHEGKSSWRPDFIILSDVIEHFQKEEGRKLIYDLMELITPGGVLMIGTPGVFVEQDAVHGNEYERHKSLWAWNEFPPGFEVIKNGQGDEFGHYMILVKYVKPK